MVVAGKPLHARVASAPVAMRARRLNLPLSRLTKKASGRVATLARLRGNLTRQPRAALMN
jgi:hypothetical protein